MHLYNINIRVLILWLIIPFYALPLNAQIADQKQIDNDFYKIYTKVLSTKCSTSGCHDGSFEPDYTSIYSSYYSLVYHPIVKNNRSGDFSYRVFPFSSAKSVLLERITNDCFVNEGDRMPFYDQDGLSLGDIQLIKKWIDEGAKDLNNNVPKTLCLPINVTNINIFARTDKKTLEVNEYYLDYDGEIQGLSISSEIRNMKIHLSLSNNMMSCSNINYESYFLKCVKQLNGKTEEIRLRLKFNKNKTLAFAHLRSGNLEDFDKLFLYLSDSNEYSYPHPEVLFSVLAQWVLVKETNS